MLLLGHMQVLHLVHERIGIDTVTIVVVAVVVVVEVIVVIICLVGHQFDYKMAKQLT